MTRYTIIAALALVATLMCVDTARADGPTASVMRVESEDPTVRNMRTAVRTIHSSVNRDATWGDARRHVVIYTRVGSDLKAGIKAGLTEKSNNVEIFTDVSVPTSSVLGGASVTVYGGLRMSM